MSSASQALPRTLFPFIGYFLKGHKSAIVPYCLLAFAAGFWGPLNSLLLKQLINRLPAAAQEGVGLLWVPASLLVLNFIVLDNFTWRGATYIRYRFLPSLLSQIDSALLGYTLQHSYQFFQERMAGTLSKQFFQCVDGIEKILSSSLCNFLRASSLLLMAFICAFGVHPVFFTILVVWSLIFFSFSLGMSKKLATLAEEQAAKESVLGGQIIDSLSHAMSVHLFSGRQHETSRREPALAEYKKAYQAKERYALCMHAIQGGLIALMMAFAVYFLIYLYGKGLVTIGDFALILGLSMETGHMMWFTMSEVDEFNKAAGRCKQSLKSLLLPLSIQDKPEAKPLEYKAGKITFDQVTFQYQKGKDLFQDLSVEVLPGQKVGLVGYSGGGKTSFISLMLRLYDLDKGRILIDGQNIQDITQASLREAIAVIPQDPALFHRSLMENIRYGRLDATDAEVMEAAKRAHAHLFIQQLPQGYDTLVGERGVKLSGGQRQRIAIARAFLKNAPILVLDEATIQLDSLTESLIQASLWDLIQSSPHSSRCTEASAGVIGSRPSSIDMNSSAPYPKTVIVVAHRLSTLLHMDRILVFDKGSIVEDGSHTALMQENGLYKTLWDAQVGGFLGDSGNTQPSQEDA